VGREEGDQILNALLPFARQMLEKHGAFHPFGGIVDREGKTVLLGAYDGNERPPAQTLITMMIESLKKEAPTKGYRAAGICFDVRVLLPSRVTKTDAIQVAIEYADGEAVDVYLPYSKSWLKRVRYCDLIATRGTPKIFTSPK
jgi:hypothetical protein